MKITQMLYVTLIMAVAFGFTACSHKTVPAAAVSNANNGIDTANLQQDILFNINQYRQSIGLPALQLLNIASLQAARHSASMAKKLEPLGHAGFEVRVTAISRSLGGTVSAAAENVAEGKLTAKQVVAGWVHSPGHKKNIEGKYTFTGIGYAIDPDGTIFYTEIFIQK